MERAAIRAHLVKRQHRLRRFELEFRVSEIQRRLQREYHRRAPRMGTSISTAPAAPGFTAEELEHLASIFANANDPLSAAIGAKAAAMLERA